MNHADFEVLLGGVFPSIAPARLKGMRGWSLTPSVPGGQRVGVTVDHAWASLHANADRAGAALDTLCAQSAWPGGVKHGEAQGRPTLRAEVPLLMDTLAGRAWVERQLRACLDGMLATMAGQACAKKPAQDGGAAQDPEFLAFACSGGGWNANARPDGAVRIDLEVRGARRSILLRTDGPVVRASVALAAGALPRASGPCRAATGLFLMRASAALRWARAFANGENGELDSAGFECLIAAPCCEPALLLAVDTLIAACELFGREAEALLEHPEIAARYLECASPADREAPDDSLSTGVAARTATHFPAAHAAIA